MERKKQVIALMEHLLTDSEKNPDKTVEEVLQEISCKLRKIYSDHPVDSQEG
ncbi:hypothetical protein [Alteribacillus iranensis]|uniref:Uncharacterized protein n=1 Tax=Alteribacillus iranensis TaxID=930128 RepID=A0A1I2B0G0_9BACI|nr:hypothetical protein [Alteribacillus iranensis]SFE49654.1 hypothetical protein SAMN05192532_10216 [Alteribacillus iranensis]